MDPDNMSASELLEFIANYDDLYEDQDEETSKEAAEKFLEFLTNEDYEKDATEFLSDLVKTYRKRQNELIFSKLASVIEHNLVKEAISRGLYEALVIKRLAENPKLIEKAKALNKFYKNLDKFYRTKLSPTEIDSISMLAASHLDNRIRMAALAKLRNRILRMYPELRKLHNARVQRLGGRLLESARDAFSQNRV